VAPTLHVYACMNWNPFWNRRQQRNYRNPIAGGGLLSLLAFFGWRNRERIRDFFRQRFGSEDRSYQDPMMHPPTV
jgi:hypothetical protein